MISCCHVAIALALANLIQLLCFFGYSLDLDGRTAKLEKKNGKELAEIEKLKSEIQALKSK